MASVMLSVLDAIRRIVARHAITTTTLPNGASAGSTTIEVATTKRFHAGDQIVLRDENENTEPMPGLLQIADVPDETHLTLYEPLALNWPSSATPSIFKTIRGQYVKGIYIGEPAVIPQFPAITVNGKSRDSEWMALRLTKERYNIEIGVFVEDATMEDGYRTLCELTDIIQAGLKENIYFLVNDYAQSSTLADIQPGDDVIKVADSSLFQPYSRILIEDKFNVFESEVICVLDPTTIQIGTTSQFQFKVSDETCVINAKHFIFNSWPAQIDYGYIHKGTLLKGAVISFFAEEAEPHFQMPWMDTQLR